MADVTDLHRVRKKRQWENLEDNRELTLRETLEMMLSDIDELEEEGFNKGMFIFLQDVPPEPDSQVGTYRKAWYLCDMRASEGVTLCEDMKIDMFKMMGRISNDLDED